MHRSCRKSFDDGLKETFYDFEITNQSVLTAVLPEFTNSSKDGESRITEYETSDNEFIEHNLRPLFYANGNCKENEGYVSIIFYEFISENITDLIRLELNCTISIIDTAGYKRFQQTFVYILDGKSHTGLENESPKLGFDRYLKRDTLCNESSELLPGDSLNIHIQVNYHIRHRLPPFTPFTESVFFDGKKYFFDLDSPFGQKLCELCDYFRRASDTPMIENETRRIHFPEEEFLAFSCMFSDLMHDEEMTIDSVNDICQLYAVADKYGIETVIETSRQLLKSFLCRINDVNILQHAEESIPKISELAERYNDRSLKKMVAVFLENKKFEVDESGFIEHFKDSLPSDWNCKYNVTSNKFQFLRNERKDKDPEMDFYK